MAQGRFEGMVEFRANGNVAQGYLATPESGRGPGVIVIQEWWGLVDHIKDVVRRFADEGFIALAPDLFQGESTTSPDRAGKLMMALNIAETAKALSGAADYLLSRDGASSGRLGVIGFCMGGQLALYAGVEYPDRFAAVVDFYGIHPDVPVEPSRLRVPVLAHFGTRDDLVAHGDAQRLVERLRAAGGQVEAHFYDAGHAFFNDARPEAYVRSAAELAWSRTLEFLRKNIT